MSRPHGNCQKNESRSGASCKQPTSSSFRNWLLQRLSSTAEWLKPWKPAVSSLIMTAIWCQPPCQRAAVPAREYNYREHFYKMQLGGSIKHLWSAIAFHIPSNMMPIISAYWHADLSVRLYDIDPSLSGATSLLTIPSRLYQKQCC